MIQAAQTSADPVAQMHQNLWIDGNVFARLIFYWQLPMLNRDLSFLTDGGWDIFRLLYIEEREFSNAVKSETAWNSAKDALGFDTYTVDDASALENENDFMLVAVSSITGRDHRPVFDMWGITYSAKAAAQLDSKSYPEAQKEYWVIPDENRFSDPYDTSLPVDGTTTWPW
jgi:hypothetical protein